MDEVDIFEGKSQIVNDNVGNLIVSKRGLRQSDLFSCLLFVLAANTFTKMLKFAYQNGINSGLAPFNFDGRLLNLQYANDSVLFVNTDTYSIRALKLLLYGYELVSDVLKSIFIYV